MDRKKRSYLLEGMGSVIDLMPVCPPPSQLEDMIGNNMSDIDALQNDWLTLVQDFNIAKDEVVMENNLPQLEEINSDK